jgi:hypothetical protein
MSVRRQDIPLKKSATETQIWVKVSVQARKDNGLFLRAACMVQKPIPGEKWPTATSQFSGFHCRQAARQLLERVENGCCHLK